MLLFRLQTFGIKILALFLLKFLMEYMIHATCHFLPQFYSALAFQLHNK